MKKLLRIRGLVERGGLLEREEFPNCFISFPSEKHVFITIGFVLSGEYSRLLDPFFHLVYFFLEMIYYEICFPFTLFLTIIF